MQNNITYKLTRVIKRLLLYLVLILFLLVFSFPFYYVFVLATRSYDTIFNTPPPFFFGTYIIHNIEILFKQLPFGFNIINSCIIAVLSTGTKIFFCTMAGFTLAKYKFPGRQLIYTFIIITIMLPRFLNIIPIFKMMVWFGWVNTYFPMFVPGMADAFGIFLMTQYIHSSIPDSLLDAARMDGLNDFQILIRIAFPLSKQGLAILGIISFIGSWNDLLYALVMLPGKKMQTIPVALSSLHFMAEGDYGALMIGNALSLIPLLIIFIAFSKRIVSSFLASSIKG